MEYCSSCRTHIRDCNCSIHVYEDKKYEEKKFEDKEQIKTSCHLGSVSTSPSTGMPTINRPFSVPCGEKAVVYENFTNNHNKSLVTVSLLPPTDTLIPCTAVLIIETKHDKCPIKKHLSFDHDIAVLVEDVTRVIIKCMNTTGTENAICQGFVDIEQLVCVCCPEE